MESIVITYCDGGGYNIGDVMMMMMMIMFLIPRIRHRSCHRSTSHVTISSTVSGSSSVLKGPRAVASSLG